MSCSQTKNKGKHIQKKSKCDTQSQSVTRRAHKSCRQETSPVITGYVRGNTVNTRSSNVSNRGHWLGTALILTSAIGLIATLNIEKCCRIYKMHFSLQCQGTFKKKKCFQYFQRIFLQGCCDCLHGELQVHLIFSAARQS